MIIKNAIFDLDGTIVDSMPAWRNVELDVLEDMYSIKLHMAEREELSFCTYTELLGILNNRYSIDIDMDDVSSESFRRMKDVYLSGKLETKPYIEEYLNYLKRSGCGIALATATTKDISSAFLKKIGFSKYFDYIYTTPDDARIDKEQSPAVYDLALDSLGGTKENTAVFEDVLACIKTCKGNGYYTIAVADGLQKYNVENIKKLADKYIKSYKEMLI